MRSSRPRRPSFLRRLSSSSPALFPLQLVPLLFAPVLFADNSYQLVQLLFADTGKRIHGLDILDFKSPMNNKQTMHRDPYSQFDADGCWPTPPSTAGSSEPSPLHHSLLALLSVVDAAHVVAADAAVVVHVVMARHRPPRVSLGLLAPELGCLGMAVHLAVQDAGVLRKATSSAGKHHHLHAVKGEQCECSLSCACGEYRVAVIVSSRMRGGRASAPRTSTCSSCSRLEGGACSCSASSHPCGRC